MSIALLAVPFITSGVMFGVKWLAGLYATNNGPQHTIWLRSLLILFSFLGYVATSTMNGTPVDPNIVSSDLTVLIGTGILSVLAHGFYVSFFAGRLQALRTTAPLE